MINFTLAPVVPHFQSTFFLRIQSLTHVSCQQMYVGVTSFDRPEAAWAVIGVLCVWTGGKKLSKTFSRRIIWRDLAYWQLHHWPQMPVKPIRQPYEGQVRFSLPFHSVFLGVLCSADHKAALILALEIYGAQIPKATLLLASS